MNYRKSKRGPIKGDLIYSPQADVQGHVMRVSEHEFVVKWETGISTAYTVQSASRFRLVIAHLANKGES